MVVGVDGRSLRRGSPARGVARYLTHSLLALCQRATAENLRLRLLSFDQAATSGLPAAVERVPAPLPSQFFFGLSALVRRPRLDTALRRPDVVWMPAVAPAALSPETRLVLTVHDLSFELAPRDFSRYERAWHRLARPAELARRARVVVVPSERTRRLVCERWRLPGGRVRVVRPGPGCPPATPAERASDRVAAPVGARTIPPNLEPRGYVLAVGALEPRKSPDLLVEAHALAARRGLRARLVFAGDGPLRRRLEKTGATLLGRVDDETLEALYRNALCLACPSRDEGFGFTPLEAAARGTPSVVSDLDVFDETLDGAALRFPPGDAAALADRLLTIERDSALRDELGRRARRAVAALSWERAAEALAAAFAEAAA